MPSFVASDAHEWWEMDSWLLIPRSGVTEITTNFLGRYWQSQDGLDSKIDKTMEVVLYANVR